MLLRRFKEAINECSAALNAQPGYQKALVRRSKAYENIGHFKQALSDIQKANKSESVTTPETQVHIPCTIEMLGIIATGHAMYWSLVALASQPIWGMFVLVRHQLS